MHYEYRLENMKIEEYQSLAVEQRTCLVCKQTCVEDEKHLLMYCQGFTTIRHELCSHISKIDISYMHLSENERTKYLFRADKKKSKIVGKYPGGGTWVNFCWVCAAGLSEPLPHYSLFCSQL